MEALSSSGRDSNIQALLSTKDVAVVEIVLLDCLHDIYFLFAFENADFETRVCNQDNQEKSAAERAHFGGQSTSSLVNLHYVGLTKLVIA